ncbi:MAG: hypothetical protein GXN98_04275, partial [Euryarchaeota archaeon]|nr:hypothetical protein [Euryarchaeota archaeon]
AGAEYSGWLILLSALLLLSTAGAAEEFREPGAPCISCHDTVTPGIVKQWEESKHSKVGVKCYVCHQAKEDDPSGFEHMGYRVTAVVSPRYCESCHPKQVEEFSRSKHAWAAFIGPLKPWYKEMVEQGKDPLKLETAIENNPREFIRGQLTPLYPDSGALERIGLLEDESYYQENQVLGCLQCHGSYVIARDGKLVDGWPNNGIGRINPDGSMGTCTACHTRHRFSIAEARKPETCGQCHLGPDHPQLEIYEESKHGTIYASSGEEWNWDVPPGQWGPEDIAAPTCATCHMSGFAGVVESTHDVGARLYWELQAKRSTPQWDDASKVPLGEQKPDEEQAKRGRAEMKKVCRVCHSSTWVDGYFESFDKVVSDYNRVYDYTEELLNQAYEEGLISRDNPIDELPEVMYYYIWHHDGRRWRMGASMMGPDWTHWNGAVDALMDKLNMMEEWLEMKRENRELEERVSELESRKVCAPSLSVLIALLPVLVYGMLRRRRM